jgi:hypothetical protein
VTCQQALELMGDLMDDGLDLQRHLRLRLHLVICRHCRRYLASYRITVRAAKGAFHSFAVPGANEEIPDQQVAAILNELRRT